jgi:hypothetical protein
VTDSAAEHHAANRQGSTTAARLCICLTIIVLGLCLRGLGFRLGLPGLIVKYGGSVLWATMLFFVVAIAAPGLPRRHLVPIAAVIAIGVELSRLVHFPWLDAFRWTLAGALLLGRIFSPWDILAYGVGIILGMLLDRISSSIWSR